MKSQALENIGTPPSDYQSMASGPPSKSPLKITSRFDSDDDLPLLKEREGDVISAHRALLTLAKGFVGTGCLSLPYAWKQGGIWVRRLVQFYCKSESCSELYGCKHIRAPLRCLRATLRSIAFVRLQ